MTIKAQFIVSCSFHIGACSTLIRPTVWVNSLGYSFHSARSSYRRRFYRGIPRCLYLGLRFTICRPIDRQSAASLRQLSGRLSQLSRREENPWFQPLVLDTGRLQHAYLGHRESRLDILRSLPTYRTTAGFDDPIPVRHAWHVFRDGTVPESGK